MHTVFKTKIKNPETMKKLCVKIFLLISFSFLMISNLVAQEDMGLDDLVSISFDDLMHVKIVSASGTEEELMDAPSTMIIITDQEIIERGYSNLAEIVQDLPGFDISVANATTYQTSYQRGYRTPFTQRTLIMINGIIDNNLFMQTANISRQYPINNIKRIEVLYGPVSAVYGANAFLGVINIITKDGSELKDGTSKTLVSSRYGSFNTVAADISTMGKSKGFSYSIGATVFKSDEPDFSGRGGFMSNDKLGNRDYFGPLLDMVNNNKKFGTYYDPSDDAGIVGQVSYKGLTFGGIAWIVSEAYGVQYPGDRCQVNGKWNKKSSQFYLSYNSDKDKPLRYTALALYRGSNIDGNWVEAEPDWNEGMENYSYISFTNWNSVNNSYLVKQGIEADVGKNVLFSAGLKYERKNLTKAYDVPGYWEGSFSSSTLSDQLGPYGLGLGIYHSTDSVYVVPPLPNPRMPIRNIAATDDIGGYVQMIADMNKFRFNAGIRYDNNSIYGGSVNPRASIIYKYAEKGSLKLIYGEAFQEPAPVMLWGGWSGRNANPDLKPEKARNIELNALYQTGKFFHSLSAFTAFYNNVIKEEAENAGKRYIYGVEYRANLSLKNPFPESPELTAYLYYTFIKALSEKTYSYASSEWIDDWAETGDIAPHKINVGVNMPVGKQFNIFLNGNYVSSKVLYSRNPLREQGEKLDSYFTLNTNIRYAAGIFAINAKVYNVLNSQYYHSGVESASAGNDYANRSLGWHNSLLPQPGRWFLFSLTVKIDGK